MKTPLLYGIGITCVTSAFTLIIYLLGYWTDPEKLTKAMILGSCVGLLTSIIGIILGTRRVRDQRGGVEFTYGQAYAAGFLVAIFAGLSGLVFNFFFFKFLTPDFAATQAEWMRGFMEKMNAPPDKIEEAVEKVRTTTTIGRQLLNGLLASVIWAAVISAITAAFLKRKAPDEPPLVG